MFKQSPSRRKRTLRPSHVSFSCLFQLVFNLNLNPEPECHWKLGQHETNAIAYNNSTFFGGYFFHKQFFPLPLVALFWDVSRRQEQSNTTTIRVFFMLNFRLISFSSCYSFFSFWILWIQSTRKREARRGKCVTFGSLLSSFFCVSAKFRCHRALEKWIQG